MLELILGKTGMLEEDSEGEAAVGAKSLEDTLFRLVRHPCNARFFEEHDAAQRAMSQNEHGRSWRVCSRLEAWKQGKRSLQMSKHHKHRPPEGCTARWHATKSRSQHRRFRACSVYQVSLALAYLRHIATSRDYVNFSRRNTEVTDAGPLRCCTKQL